jgi:hypothetical protein
MQKARDRTFRRSGIVLSRLVDTRFQILFTPLAGVLFTFPSRYWFAIGRQVVFSLGRWSSQIPTGFHGPRGTQVPSRRSVHFAYAALTLFGRPSQAVRLWTNFVTPREPCRAPWTVLQPRTCNAGRLAHARFGLFRVRSPLLAESLLISLPRGTEMFQFPRFAATRLWIQRLATPA